MFTVSIGAKDYRVVFSHTFEGTICSIQELVDGEHREVVWGQSKRNPLDTPNKAVGRKIALARALGDMFSSTFAKSERKAFWDAYFAKLNASRATCSKQVRCPTPAYLGVSGTDGDQ
jgi:hypothetical protein